MTGCNCNTGLSNTGRPGCVPIFSVVSSAIMLQLTAADGTRNGIDLSAPLPTWATLVNLPDATKRWFPLPSFENVELPKADTQFEEASSGRMAYLRTGKRSFTGELWAEDSTPTFLGKMQTMRCVDFGIYLVDVNGNLIGSEENGFLYPIPVDNSSWDPKFMYATDSTVQKIMLGFDIDRLFDESTLYMISPEESGILFTSLRGLIDVVFTAITGAGTFDATSFTAKLPYGTALNKLPYAGATSLTDWTVYNNTAAAAVGVTSVIDPLTNGVYTVGFAAQTAGDVLTVSVSKNGFTGTFNVTL